MSKSMVKNYVVRNVDEYTDMFIKRLIEKNIRYCEIKYPVYTEIHIEDAIYRFYSFIKIQSINNFEISNNLAKKLTTVKPKKEQTGLKKYTKSLIKRENRRFKPNTKKR